LPCCPPKKTGVFFANTLTEGLNTNILAYQYFYNGGGVAVGDLNNDGLPDLYFTANMAPNRLYLNKGDMQLADVTAASGAGGREGPWKTGVTLADVNGDGRLDVYVCYSGKMIPEKRANQLFINEGADGSGMPRFTEQAARYGLASRATSTQAIFLTTTATATSMRCCSTTTPSRCPSSTRPPRPPCWPGPTRRVGCACSATTATASAT
jgi:hypothetical protein